MGSQPGFLVSSPLQMMGNIVKLQLELGPFKASHVGEYNFKLEVKLEEFEVANTELQFGVTIIGILPVQ